MRLNKAIVSCVAMSCGFIGILIFTIIQHLMLPIILCVVVLLISTAVHIPIILALKREYKKALEEEQNSDNNN